MPQREYHRTDAVWHIRNGTYPCYVRHDILSQLCGKWEAFPIPYLTPEEVDAVIPWVHCRKHSAISWSEGHYSPVGFHPDDPLEEHGPEFPIEKCYPKLICKFGSGFSALLQMGMIEGYSPIYLVGTDLGFKAYEEKVDPNHFDKTYFSDNTTTEEQARGTNDILVRMHELSRDMAGPLGIEIFNATKGGELEVYPRVEYDSLF